MGSARVRSAGIAGDSIREHADRQRTQAVGVAEGDHAVLAHHHDRERPVQPWEHVGDRVLDVLRGMGGEQRRHDLRIGGGAERHAARRQLVVQLDRVDEVAVVGERELATGPVGALRALHRLGVLPRVRPGGGVAHVADRKLPGERAQVVLGEHLAHEPQLAAGHDVAAVVGRRDPRRLLAAVLERVQREVRQARDLVSGRVYAKHTALVARSVTVLRTRVQGHRLPYASSRAAHRGGLFGVERLLFTFCAIASGDYDM